MNRWLFACLIVLFSREPGRAELWSWSPAGAPHHAAVCQVQSGDRAGSGVYVRRGQVEGVLTARHVLAGPEATVTFATGATVRAEATVDRFGNDVAFVLAKSSRVTPAAIATAAPAPGERVEFVSRGAGPRQSTLRHFWATLDTSAPPLARYRASVISGDSGGAIFNANGEVIGVIQGGFTPLAGTGWPTYQGAVAADHAVVCQFLDRIGARWYSGPQQRGGLYPPPQRPGCLGAGCPSAPQMPAPEPQPPMPGPSDPAGPPATPSPNSGDGAIPRAQWEAAMAEIRAELAALKAARAAPGPQGPPGPKGDPGPKGEPGPPATLDLDALAAEIARRLPPITFYTRRPDGSVIERSEVRLGESQDFYLVPQRRGQ